LAACIAAAGQWAHFIPARGPALAWAVLQAARAASAACVAVDLAEEASMVVGFMEAAEFEGTEPQNAVQH